MRSKCYLIIEIRQKERGNIYYVPTISMSTFPIRSWAVALSESMTRRVSFSLVLSDVSSRRIVAVSSHIGFSSFSMTLVEYSGFPSREYATVTYGSIKPEGKLVNYIGCKDYGIRTGSSMPIHFRKFTSTMYENDDDTQHVRIFLYVVAGENLLQVKSDATRSNVLC